MMTRKFVTKDEATKIFPSLPKRKGRTISNPLPLQSSPFVTKKPNKK